MELGDLSHVKVTVNLGGSEPVSEFMRRCCCGKENSLENYGIFMELQWNWIFFFPREYELNCSGI